MASQECPPEPSCKAFKMQTYGYMFCKNRINQIKPSSEIAYFEQINNTNQYKKNSIKKECNG